MTNTAIEPLVRRIDRYLRRADMSETRFGRHVANNGSLVQRLRDGAVTLKTMNRVSAWLDVEEAKLKDAA